MVCGIILAVHARRRYLLIHISDWPHDSSYRWRKAGAVLQATSRQNLWLGGPENVSEGTRRLAADRAGCWQGFATRQQKCFTCCVRAQPEFHLALLPPYPQPLRTKSKPDVSLAVSRLAVARGASLHQSPSSHAITVYPPEEPCC